MNLISWKGRFCTALRGCSLGHPLFSSHWKGNIQILTIWLLYAMRHFHKTIYGIFCKIRSVPSCDQIHIHTSVRKNQQKQILEDLHYIKIQFFIYHSDFFVLPPGIRLLSYQHQSPFRWTCATEGFSAITNLYDISFLLLW